MRTDPAVVFAAELRNAGWFVRWYRRPHQREQRARALRTMGLAARAGFNATEDFELLLFAIADALTDRPGRSDA